MLFDEGHFNSPVNGLHKRKRLKLLKMFSGLQFVKNHLVNN